MWLCASQDNHATAAASSVSLWSCLDFMHDHRDPKDIYLYFIKYLELCTIVYTDLASVHGMIMPPLQPPRHHYGVDSTSCMTTEGWPKYHMVWGSGSHYSQLRGALIHPTNQFVWSFLAYKFYRLHADRDLDRSLQNIIKKTQFTKHPRKIKSKISTSAFYYLKQVR